VIVIFGLLLNWYIAPKTVGERKDLVQTLAQIVAGLGFFGTLYFTWRTLRVNREGQVTDRFTKAIAQLGDETLQIRLGGIYALERISRDSERDYGPIMEVLTAYVRDKAPSTAEEPETSTSRAAASTEATGGATVPGPSTSSRAEPQQKDKKPPTDIQAVLTVLGRRAVPVPVLDLGRTNLIGAHLEDAFLMDAILEKAYLLGAHLNGAFLNGAFLNGAHLNGAHLNGAHLEGAHLEKAYLLGAHLEGADLHGANGLTWKQIDQAFTDGETRLPDDLLSSPRRKTEAKPSDDEGEGAS
jgi:hypothetical protein